MLGRLEVRDVQVEPGRSLDACLDEPMRRVAGSELHIVPERGHGIFLEDPEGFNALVDRFLNTIKREHE